MDTATHGPGSVLNARWQLEEQLGRGAMGEVYRGRDLVLERPVAVKMLAASLLDDEIMRARFRREALSSSRLMHPNIVTTLDFGIDGSAPYIVMELVDGESLDHVLRRGRLQPARAARLARDIARGLEAAHRQGIVHRDIKPSNVMVTRTNGVEVARLMDFGIARASDTGPRLTMVGLAVGTPGYIAPEQLGRRELGPPADVFSLGVTLYEMLSGTLPWAAEDPMLLLGAMLRDDPRPIERVRPVTPLPLRALVMSMIEREVGKRPASAAEVAQRLESIITAASSATPAVAAPVAENPGRPSALASASLDPDRRLAAQQMAWLQRVVEDEGGTITQSIGREVLALLPSAEACLRLSRTFPPADVERPSLGLHVGEVVMEEDGIALGSGIRVALHLARLGRPGEVLLTQPLHDAIGLGWRGRLDPRGNVRLDSSTHHEVFALRGSQGDEPDEIASVEDHADGLHWRCPCGGHGRVPNGSASQMRVRCSMCSRLIEFDVAQPPRDLPDAAVPVAFDHPLTSIVLTSGSDSQTPGDQTDDDLIAALSSFGD